MNNTNKMIVKEIAKNLSITTKLFHQLDFSDTEMTLAEGEKLCIAKDSVPEVINGKLRWSKAEIRRYRKNRMLLGRI